MQCYANQCEKNDASRQEGLHFALKLRSIVTLSLRLAFRKFFGMKLTYETI